MKLHAQNYHHCSKWNFKCQHVIIHGIRTGAVPLKFSSVLNEYTLYPHFPYSSPFMLKSCMVSSLWKIVLVLKRLVCYHLLNFHCSISLILLCLNITVVYAQSLEGNLICRLLDLEVLIPAHSLPPTSLAFIPALLPLRCRLWEGMESGLGSELQLKAFFLSSGVCERKQAGPGVISTPREGLGVKGAIITFLWTPFGRDTGLMGPTQVKAKQIFWFHVVSWVLNFYLGLGLLFDPPSKIDTMFLTR